MIRSLGPCRTCHGTKVKDVRVQEAFGHWKTVTRTCPACHGSGEARIHVGRGSNPAVVILAIACAWLIGFAIVLLLIAMPAEAKAAEPGRVDSSGVEVGYATWCRPKGDKCLEFGEPAKVAAVPGYDGPFDARVCREDDPSHCVDVRVIGSCACGDRHGRSTVIDLSPAAFRELEPLGTGVLLVAVERLGRSSPTLPPTDLEADVSAAAITAARTLPVWRGPAVALLALGIMGLVAYAVGSRSER